MQTYFEAVTFIRKKKKSPSLGYLFLKKKKGNECSSGLQYEVGKTGVQTRKEKKAEMGTIERIERNKRGGIHELGKV